MAATDAPVPISALPDASGLTEDYTVVVVDTAGSTAKVTVGDMLATVAAGPTGPTGPPVDPASGAEAITGTDNTKAMTPIRVREMAPHFPVQNAVGNGLSNDQVVITAALTLAQAAQASGGASYPDRYPAVVLRPDRAYATTSLTIPQGVRLLCNGAELVALEGGNLVSLAGRGASIEDGLLRGLGAGTALNGVLVTSGNIINRGVRRCLFNSFAGSAIRVEGNAVRIEDCFAQNCVLDDTVLASPTGVLHIEGANANDVWVENCEFTASNLTLSTSGNAYAVVVLGKACSLNGVIAEISDHGYYVNGTHNKFSNCRADLNRGHGWVFAGGEGVLSTCYSLSNGRQTTNTYDGFLVTGGQYYFDACRADVLSTLTAVQHRYGFNATESTTSGGPVFGSTCSSANHATAAVAAVDPGARVVPTVGPFLNTSGTGTTWNAQTYRWPHTSWNLAAGSARNLSTITGGVPGQRLTLRGDGNTTLVHNGSFTADTFRLTGGVNVLTAAHTFYEFVRASGAWIQL